MEECIFCKIIHKEIPAEIVFENENIIAFKDIDPAAPIHVLVIPKKHIPSLNEVQKEDMAFIAEVHEVIQEVAKSQGVYESGYRVIMNAGEDSGQEVKHIHFHVLGGKKLGEKIRE